MRGDGAQGLGGVEVVAELRTLLLLAGDDGGGRGAGLVEERAQLGAQVGVLGDLLRDDVARAGERGLGVGDLLRLVDVGRGDLLWGEGRLLGEQVGGERGEAALAGDLGAGAALGAVGQVDVLEAGERLAGLDLRAELVGKEAALLERGEDGGAAVVERAEAVEGVANRGDRDLVELAGGLLAVAGDEGDGGAALEEGGDGGDLAGAQGKGGGRGAGKGRRRRRRSARDSCGRPFYQKRLGMETAK